MDNIISQPKERCNPAQRLILWIIPSSHQQWRTTTLSHILTTSGIVRWRNISTLRKDRMQKEVSLLHFVSSRHSFSKERLNGLAP